MQLIVILMYKLGTQFAAMEIDDSSRTPLAVIIVVLSFIIIVGSIVAAIIICIPRRAGDVKNNDYVLEWCIGSSWMVWVALIGVSSLESWEGGYCSLR